MNYIKRKSQKGFTLLELVLVMVVVGFMMILEMEKKTSEFEQLQARQLGMQIFEYSKGAQGFISNSGPSIKDRYGSIYSPADGAAWLRDTSCGGVDHAAGAVEPLIPNNSHVSCNFLRDTGELTTFGGLTFKTTIENETIVLNPSAPVADQRTSEGWVATTIVEKPGGGPLDINGDGEPDHRLQGLAAGVAAGSSSINSGTASLLTSSGQIFYCITGSRDGCAGNEGKIVIRNTTFSENDVWLRTDHGNKMKSAIEFDSSADAVMTSDNAADPDGWGLGYSLRQIKNVARIYNEGSRADHRNNDLTSALILGHQESGLTFSPSSTLYRDLLDASVVVDSDLSIMGKIRALDDIQTDGGDLVAIKGVGADGTNRGGNVIARGGDVKSETVGTDGGNIIADNNIIGGDTDGGYLHIKQATNPLFNMSTTASSIKTGSGFIDNELWVGDEIHAPRMIDRNNASYYVDPNGLTVLNDLRARDDVTIDGDLYVDDTATFDGNTNFRNGNVNFQRDINSNSTFRVNYKGRMTDLHDLLPRITLQSMRLLGNGGTISKPSCPSGATQKIVVTPAGMQFRTRQVGTERGGNVIGSGGIVARAINRGSYWSIYVQSVYGDQGRGQAVVKTYCVL